MTMTPVRVLRALRVASPGNIYGREIVAGTDDAVPSDLVDGLVAEGYVERIKPAKAAPTEPHHPGHLAEETDFPANWRGMHHKTLVALAKKFDPSVETKADAVTVMEHEEKARAAPANKAIGAAPENKSA